MLRLIAVNLYLIDTIMKNRRYTFLTILCSAFCLFPFFEGKAQNTCGAPESFFSEFYVMQVKPMEFLLTYHYPITDRVLVRIKDVANNVLFVEKTLVYKQYRKSFDLSSLKDGSYTFELRDGDETFVKSFDVATKTRRVAVALTESDSE